MAGSVRLSEAVLVFPIRVRQGSNRSCSTTVISYTVRMPTPRSRTIARALVMIFAAAFLPNSFGCSSSKTIERDPLSVVPEDLSIDVTILTGRGVHDQEQAHRRQGKMILLADGTLHADWGPNVSWGTRPGETRTLRREQSAELWALARQLGLADAASGEEPVNFGLIEAEKNELVYLLVFASQDDRWAFVRRQNVADPTDPSIATFVRAMAGLAWERDAVDAETHIEPLRYDFGPDPYARYRAASTQPTALPAPRESIR